MRKQDIKNVTLSVDTIKKSLLKLIKEKNDDNKVSDLSEDELGLLLLQEELDKAASQIGMAEFNTFSVAGQERARESRATQIHKTELLNAHGTLGCIRQTSSIEEDMAMITEETDPKIIEELKKEQEDQILLVKAKQDLWDEVFPVKKFGSRIHKKKNKKDSAKSARLQELADIIKSQK